MGSEKTNGQYGVLNPWAETDPIPLKGISPGFEKSESKKIGIFCNSKRGARPVMTVIAERLREFYPEHETIWYVPKKSHRYQVLQTECENKETFEKWLDEVDGVVASLGD